MSTVRLLIVALLFVSFSATAATSESEVDSPPKDTPVVKVPKSLEKDAEATFARKHPFFIWAAKKEPDVWQPFGFPTIVELPLRYAIAGNHKEYPLFVVVFRVTAKDADEKETLIYTTTTEGPKTIGKSGETLAAFFAPNKKLQGSGTVTIHLVEAVATKEGERTVLRPKIEKVPYGPPISNMLRLRISIPDE